MAIAEMRKQILEQIADIINDIHWGGLATKGGEKSESLVSKMYDDTITTINVPHTISELRKLKKTEEWNFPLSIDKDETKWLEEIQGIVKKTTPNKFNFFSKFYNSFIRGRLDVTAFLYNTIATFDVNNLASLELTSNKLNLIIRDPNLFTWRIPDFDPNTDWEAYRNRPSKQISRIN